MSRCPRSLRKRPLASLNAPATQRSVICPSFQRLALRGKCAIEPLRFSIALKLKIDLWRSTSEPSDLCRSGLRL